MSLHNTKEKAKAVALGGMLSALAVALMSVGSIIESLDMSSAFLAGLIILIARIEINRTAPITVYFVSGILSLLLLPNKFTAICFLCFGGLYPILKEYIELVKPKVLQWILKFASFNLLYSAIIALAVFFTIPMDDIFGFKWLIYLVGNVTFLLYDVLLTIMITRYYQIFKRKKR